MDVTINFFSQKKKKICFQRIRKFHNGLLSLLHLKSFLLFLLKKNCNTLYILFKSISSISQNAIEVFLVCKYLTQDSAGPGLSIEKMKQPSIYLQGITNYVEQSVTFWCALRSITVLHDSADRADSAFHCYNLFLRTVP